MVAYVYLVGTNGILLLQIELYMHPSCTFPITIDAICPVVQASNFKNKRACYILIDGYWYWLKCKISNLYIWASYYEWITNCYTVLDMRHILVENHQSIVNLIRTLISITRNGPLWNKMERLYLLTFPKYTPR